MRPIDPVRTVEREIQDNLPRRGLTGYSRVRLQCPAILTNVLYRGNRRTTATSSPYGPRSSFAS